MPGPDALSPIGALLRRHDPDRYFTALFAPAHRRDALFTLYAFNHEIARAREAVREPMAALIRLQWWREVAEGARRRHEVAGPLGDALDAALLDPADLLAMIDEREAETGPIETMAAFEAYLLGTAGGVMVAAGRALGMDAPELLRPWGAAYGLTGVLRSIAAVAGQGRCVLPQDVLADAGLSMAAVVAKPDAPGLAAVRTRLLPLAHCWLSARPGMPRTALAAALPAVFARLDAKRGGHRGERPVTDRLWVAAAAIRGRV